MDGNQYVYAANFTKGRVDVYDNTFHLVGRSKEHSGEDPFEDQFSEHSFVDECLQRPYGPFNVQAIGNDIVVTYVVHRAGSPFETDSACWRAVDQYSSARRLLVR